MGWKGFAAALATAAMFGTSAYAADFTLKYGHVGPTTEDSDDHVAGLFLKDYLENRSQGRIKVEIFPASQMGSFREMIEAVQLNTLELTHTTTGGISQFFPELQVVAIPYIIPNDLVAERLVDSQFFKDVRAEILKRTGNVLMAGIGNTGRFRSFYTSKQQIKSAADLSGVKMRTINSPLAIELVKFLGGNPTPVAWGELYTSLKTGVVEGTKNAASDIVTNNMHEVLKFAIFDEHEYLYGFNWMSYQWLKSLPADLQPLAIDGVKQMMTLQTQFNKKIETKYNGAFVEAGGEIYVPTAEEKATFQKAQEPMVKWYVGEYGDTWYNKLVESVDKIKAEIEAEHKDIAGLK